MIDADFLPMTSGVTHELEDDADFDVEARIDACLAAKGDELVQEYLDELIKADGTATDDGGVKTWCARFLEQLQPVRDPEDSDYSSEDSVLDEDEDDDDRLARELAEKVYKLQVLRASDLLKTDTFGLTDAYVVCLIDGKEVGRSEVTEHSLNPVWAHCAFDIPSELAFSNKTVDICLQAYDYDLVGKGDFLGEVRLKPEDLQRMREDGGAEKYKLKPLPGMLATDKASKSVGGALHLAGHFIRGTPRFGLHVIDCQELASADSTFGVRGWSDPYVEIYWDGDKLGATSVRGRRVMIPRAQFLSWCPPPDETIQEWQHTLWS